MEIRALETETPDCGSTGRYCLRASYGVSTCVLRSRESFPVQGPELSEPDPSFDVPIRDQADLQVRLYDSAPREEPPLPPAPPRSSINGLLIWLAAASALVVGIIIGFASGYVAGQRSVPARTAGQAFSEAAISEPIRVEEPPAVAVPEPEESVAPPDPANRPIPNVSNVSNVPNGPGSLDILSRPSGAQVILDGRSVGRTPLTLSNIAPGPHSVRLEIPGFNRWATSVDVRPGTRSRVAASLERP